MRGPPVLTAEREGDEDILMKKLEARLTELQKLGKLPNKPLAQTSIRGDRDGDGQGGAGEKREVKRVPKGTKPELRFGLDINCLGGLDHFSGKYIGLVFGQPTQEVGSELHVTRCSSKDFWGRGASQ